MSQLKNYIFAIVCLTIALPILQANFSFAKQKVKPLHGEKRKPNSEFFPGRWLSGEYQEEKEQYLNQNFGFRPLIVRAHNELEYNLLGKVNYKDGKLGKADMLFEKIYLNEYTGRDFIGEEAIRAKMDKLSVLKDSLAKYNVLLMVVFAPSKAHYFSEYLPKGYETRGKDIHYDHFTAACKKRNIAYIDFNSYFLSLKNKTPYPLFTKTGIHWSAYGAAIAMDSLFKRLEQEKKVDLADFDWKNIEISDTCRGTDGDLFEVANLLRPIQNPKLAYPKLAFQQKEGQKKLKTLSIADSFWWDIVNSGANENVFGTWEFWNYFYDVYPQTEENKTHIKQIPKEIKKYDVVIIEACGGTLRILGWDFIEKAYEQFLHPEQFKEVSKSEFDLCVQKYITEIKNTPEWLHNLTISAEKEHISLDSIILKNAIYMAHQKFK